MTPREAQVLKVAAQIATLSPAQLECQKEYNHFLTATLASGTRECISCHAAVPPDYDDVRRGTAQLEARLRRARARQIDAATGLRASRP